MKVKLKVVNVESVWFNIKTDIISGNVEIKVDGKKVENLLHIDFKRIETIVVNGFSFYSAYVRIGFEFLNINIGESGANFAGKNSLVECCATAEKLFRIDVDATVFAWQRVIEGHPALVTHLKVDLDKFSLTYVYERFYELFKVCWRIKDETNSLLSEVMSDTLSVGSLNETRYQVILAMLKATDLGQMLNKLSI